jgi:PEP-CTERM motif
LNIILSHLCSSCRFRNTVELAIFSNTGHLTALGTVTEKLTGNFKMRRLKIVMAGLAASLSFSGSAVQAANLLADSGFETQGTTTNNYCYFDFSAGGNGPCGAGAWSGGLIHPNGGGSGFQFESNGAWPGQPTPDGTRYAFIQMGNSINQTFTPTQTGDYILTWIDAGRPAGCCGGNQDYLVTIGDGINLAPILFLGSTTTSQAWTAQTADFSVNLLAGTNYILTFQGLVTTSDQTTFIDAVSLDLAPPSAVPEPASWALMLGGFGLIGAAMRRGAGAILSKA